MRMAMPCGRRTVMDDIDVAQRLDAEHREAALKAHSEKSVDARTDDGTDCHDCGRSISPGRLKALPKARRCIDCQMKHEGLR